MMLRCAPLLCYIVGFTSVAGVSSRYAVEVKATGSLPAAKRNAVAAPHEKRPPDVVRRSQPSLVRSEAALEPKEGGAAAFTDLSASLGLTCENVIGKARNIIKAYKEDKTDELGKDDPELQTLEWLSALDQQLETGQTGAGVLEGFYRVLNSMDLGAGLRYGEIWTIQHAESFYSCNGLPGSLEVHKPMTLSKPGKFSEKLVFCGGDMRCAGDTLLPQWDRKLWEIPIPLVADVRLNVRENSSESIGAAKSNGTLPSTGGANASILESQPAGHFDYVSSQHAAKQSVSSLTEVLDPAISTTATPSEQPSEHEIMYCFSPHLDGTTQEAFLAAIEDIQMQVPCVSFRPVQADGDDCQEYPSIFVQSTSEGCWSHVGQVSGSVDFGNRSQPLNLGRGCGLKGLIVHQLGHTLGMLHEFYRPDRDNVLLLQESSLPTNYLTDSFQVMADFDIESDGGKSTESAGFDFLSVMMYSAFSFSTNGLMSSKPRDLRAVGFMGQRMGLSELDARVLGNMYGCLGEVKTSDPNAKLSLALRRASASQDLSAEQTHFNANFKGECEDRNSTSFFDEQNKMQPCRNIKSDCTHPALGEDVRKLCPRTCHMCVHRMWPFMMNKCLLCEDSDDTAPGDTSGRYDSESYPR